MLHIYFIKFRITNPKEFYASWLPFINLAFHIISLISRMCSLYLKYVEVLDRIVYRASKLATCIPRTHSPRDPRLILSATLNDYVSVQFITYTHIIVSSFYTCIRNTNIPKIDIYEQTRSVKNETNQYMR